MLYTIVIISFIEWCSVYSLAHRPLLFWPLQNVWESNINIRSSAADVCKCSPLLMKTRHTIYITHNGSLVVALHGLIYVESVWNSYFIDLEEAICKQLYKYILQYHMKVAVLWRNTFVPVSVRNSELRSSSTIPKSQILQSHQCWTSDVRTPVTDRSLLSSKDECKVSISVGLITLMFSVFTE